MQLLMVSTRPIGAGRIQRVKLFRTDRVHTRRVMHVVEHAALKYNYPPKIFG